MGHLRKIAGLFMAVAMTASVLAGCQQNQVATAPTTITVDGKEVAVPYVMKVDGQEVPLDLYRYFYLSVKYQMDNGDDSYWESHADEQDSIKEEALKAVKGFYAVAKIADDNGVGLNDDDKTQVSSRVESLIQ